MESNPSLFICRYINCMKYLKEPVILPCGFSICKEHINDLINSQVENFKCNYCDIYHSSIQDYQLNLTLKHLMNDEKCHLNGSVLKLENLLDIFNKSK